MLGAHDARLVLGLQRVDLLLQRDAGQQVGDALRFHKQPCQSPPGKSSCMWMDERRGCLCAHGVVGERRVEERVGVGGGRGRGVVAEKDHSGHPSHGGRAVV